MNALLNDIKRKTNFEVRFRDLFQDGDVPMATALHQRFRMSIVRPMSPTISFQS